MNEIIKTAPFEKEPKGGTPEIEELKNFPEGLRELFEKLPETLKKKIFPKTTDISDSPEKQETNMEALIASFDTKTREKFMGQCLNDLFYNGRFKDALSTMDEKNLEKEVTRLLNLLWHNRGKRQDIELFNKKYYENFFEMREAILKKIANKKIEMGRLNSSMVVTEKQKRLTENKKETLKRCEGEFGVLIEELKEHDNQHKNLDSDHMYFRDVSSRQKKEIKWTTATTIAAEYLDSTEFATMMAEQLDKTFRQEYSIAQDPQRKQFGKIPSEETVKRAKRITDSIDKAIELWQASHENDETLKEPPETKREKREAKLIDYLISLIYSYKIGKKLHKTDEEIIYDIRQMEITLNFLQR